MKSLETSAKVRVILVDWIKSQFNPNQRISSLPQSHVLRHTNLDGIIIHEITLNTLKFIVIFLEGNF